MRRPGQRSAAASGPDPCGALALLLLSAVPAARLLAVLHALRVERTANDLVADTGEVLHTTTAHEHHRVLLQVVALARDVGGDLDAAGQPDTRDLAERGVRLLGRGGVDAGAHAAPLRAPLERRGLLLGSLVLAALSDQLLDRGQWTSFLLASVKASAALLCGLVSPGPRGRACRPAPRVAGDP